MLLFSHSQIPSFTPFLFFLISAVLSFLSFGVFDQRMINWFQRLRFSDFGNRQKRMAVVEELKFS